MQNAVVASNAEADAALTLSLLIGDNDIGGCENSQPYRPLLPRRESRDNAGYYKRTGQMDEEG